MASPYLVTREAAAYVRKSPRSFADWVTSRGVPYVCSGRKKLFRPEHLDRMLELDTERHIRSAAR